MGQSGSEGVIRAAHVVLWEYKVRPGRAAEFELAYGPEGDWARFFRRSRDYLGTELLRDGDSPGRYVTVDRWSSRGAYEDFLREKQDEYRRIDAACEELTEQEGRVGAFAPVG